MGLSVPLRSLSPVTARRQLREEKSPRKTTSTTSTKELMMMEHSTPVVANSKEAKKVVAVTPLSKRDFRTDANKNSRNKIATTKMNDSFLNFGSDDWDCKNLGASKSTLLVQAEESLPGSFAATTTTGRLPVVPDNSSIMNYPVDEWVSDDDDDLDRKLAKLNNNKRLKNGAASSSSSTPALDKLKSRTTLRKQAAVTEEITKSQDKPPKTKSVTKKGV